MAVEIVDRCPTCGSNRVRQGSKDKALIAWGCQGGGVIVATTAGGLLESQIESMSDLADEVFADIEEEQKEGMSVWEGVVVLNVDGERVCRGKFRDLTDEEWANLRAGSPLW